MIYYHISSVKNRDSIQNFGLIPQIGERAKRFGQFCNRVYLYKKFSDVFELLNSTLWNTHPDFYIGFDIWEIDTTSKIFKDEKTEKGFFTKEHVTAKLCTTINNRI